MRKFLFVALGCLFSFGLTIPASQVHACSGGPRPWYELLPEMVEQSDTIVVGQYVELDDADANGIFRVSEYLEGTGAEHLLIRNAPITYIENRRHVNRRLSLCPGPPTLNTDNIHVYFLNRQADGTYMIRMRHSFADQTSTIGLVNQPGEPEDLTVADISDQISAEVGFDPVLPDEDSAYPRTAPILLKVANGQHFLLPVDIHELVPVPDDEVISLRRDQYECGPPPCHVYSPNGLDIVFLDNSYEDTDYRREDLFTMFYYTSGQRIVFSPTSETYAVWRDDEIQVFLLWYPRLGHPDDRLSDIAPLPELVNSIAASNSIDYPVAWSPDGRLMAFSTDEGLWLWDALMADFPPRLLLPSETTVPTARYFSPQGRYLAVTDGTRRYNLDVITNQELPDGYVSPDDRTLLIFDTAADGPTTLEIAYLAPGIRRFDYEAGVEFFEVAWINDVQFLASVTGFGFQRYENVSFEDEDGTIRYEAFPYLVEEPFVAIKQYHSSGIHWVQNELEVPFPVDDPQMRTFHYAEGPGLIELSIDGYHLRINHARDGRFDLTSQLAEPIVEAVWLPSVFYYDR